MPDTYIKPPAITACGIKVFKRGILPVLKLIFEAMAIGFWNDLLLYKYKNKH
jgi:hypothetical protein